MLLILHVGNKFFPSSWILVKRYHNVDSSKAVDWDGQFPFITTFSEFQFCTEVFVFE